MSTTASQVIIGPLTFEYSEEHQELYLVVDEEVQKTLDFSTEEWEDFVGAISLDAIDVD